jgi:hypothetical protein
MLLGLLLVQARWRLRTLDFDWRYVLNLWPLGGAG